VAERIVGLLVASVLLSGCWPALKVVQPRAEVRVTSATGDSIDAAKVTCVRANVFPGWHEVLGEYSADANGVVKLPLRLKWHVQVMLPDAYTSYSWAYCVERDGYAAVMAPLKRWHRPPIVVLNPSLTRSTCVPPDENDPLLRTSDTELSHTAAAGPPLAP